MKKYFLILILSGISFSESISGFVHDAENGEPLSFVNIVLIDTEKGGASDVHGYFIIPDIPFGRQIIQATMIGYETFELSINNVGKNIRVDINLNPSVIQLENITISGEKIQFKKGMDISRINFTSSQLRMAPAFIEDDVFRTFQLLPSVMSLNDFSAALIVRGGSPDENLVLLDNTQIYNPYHIGGIFSTFNADAVSNSEFISGGFQSEYGGHLSSVIDLTTREGNSKNGKLPDDHWLKDYWDLSGIQGEISLLSTNILAEGPFYKGSWFFSGRRTWFDQMAKAYYQFTDQKQNWNYYFWDTNFKIHSDLSSEHQFTYSKYSGLDDLNINVGGVDFPEIDFVWTWGNRTNSLNWRYFPASDFILETTLSRAKYFFDVNFEFIVSRESSIIDTIQSTGFEAIIDNIVDDRSFNQKITWYINDQFKFMAGWEYKILSLDYKEAFAGSTIRHWDQSPYIASTFLKNTIRLNPLVSCEIGVRATKYELYQKIITDPRLSCKIYPHPNLIIKGSWGHYSQYLFTINQDDQLLRIVDFWQPILEGYEPQRAQQFILGAEYWAGYGITVSLDAYYKPYSNILDLSKVFNPSESEQGFATGTAVAKGIELLVKKTEGKLNGWIGYSLSSIEKSVDYNKNGILEENLGEVYKAKYDVPHSFKTVMNYHLSKKHSISISGVYHTGQPFTPPSGRVFHQANDIFGSIENPYQRFDTYYGSKHSARFPSYFRLDLSYTRKISPWNLNGEFRFQLINLTGHYNVLLYNWQTESSPMRIKAYSMFPLLASFSWEFNL